MKENENLRKNDKPPPIIWKDTNLYSKTQQPMQNITAIHLAHKQEINKDFIQGNKANK